MRKGFKSALGFIIFLLLVVALLGYFYETCYGDIKDGEDIKISGSLSINYLNGSKLHINKSKEVTVKVSNSGDTEAYYYIEFVNPKNIKKTVNYTLTNDDDINIKDTLNNYNTIISSYIAIGPGEEDTYTIKFTSEGRLFYSLELNFEQEQLENNNFSEVILKNNKTLKSSKTNVGSELATENEGLIETTDDYGSAYYFRGNITNNYVNINNNVFRIIKINGDGSVKLVYDGVTSETRKYYSSDNYNYDSSDVINYLDSWLTEKLGDSAAFVAKVKYCNDNNKSNDEYLGYKRAAKDYNASYICVGNKIASKVGLLTADEVMYAGGVYNNDNTSYYLYNSNITSSYYLMTGAVDDGNGYYPFSVSVNGALVSSEVGSEFKNIRPVITINKVIYATGTGTYDDPYILSNEN